MFISLLFIITSAVAQDMTYCHPFITNSLDPAKDSNEVAAWMQNKVLQNLITMNDGTITSVLAEKYSISADKKEISFTLVKNISFHLTPIFKPTRMLNADDVIFSFERQKALSDFFPDNKRFEEYQSSNCGQKLSEIKKINDLTVSFKFQEPM